MRCHDINIRAWFTTFAFNCSPRTCHKRVSHWESRERVRISFYFSSRLSLLRHHPAALNTTRELSTHAWNMMIGVWVWGGVSLCRVWKVIYCCVFHISVALLHTIMNKCHYIDEWGEEEEQHKILERNTQQLGLGVCMSFHHHTFNWINQPDASVSQVYYLSFNPYPANVENMVSS